MTELERLRYLKIAQIALLAIESFEPGDEENGNNDYLLTQLVVSYGQGLNVTEEEAVRVVFSSRLCDWRKR